MKKAISLTISIVYLIISFISGGSELLIKMLLFLLLPLACIWFGEEMGNYTGPAFGFRPHITKESPGCFIKLLGWVLLLLPMAIFVLNYFSKKF